MLKIKSLAEVVSSIKQEFSLELASSKDTIEDQAISTLDLIRKNELFFIDATQQTYTPLALHKTHEKETHSSFYGVLLENIFHDEYTTLLFAHEHKNTSKYAITTRTKNHIVVGYSSFGGVLSTKHSTKWYGGPSRWVMKQYAVPFFNDPKNFDLEGLRAYQFAYNLLGWDVPSSD